MTATLLDEPLLVHEVRRMGEDLTAQCPHCKATVGLILNGPLPGEQFKHRECGGWFEISQNVEVRSEDNPRERGG